MYKDIFISYRNDGEGNNFAARLKDDLDRCGYSVYFNSHERRAGEFPLRLKTAIEHCKDFILILSTACVERLRRNEAVDWVREEVLYAKSVKKNIIPILLDNVTMPEKTQLPESLQFICDYDAILFPEQYLKSPFQSFIVMLTSMPDKEVYRNVSNSNTSYDVNADFSLSLDRAISGNYEAMFEVSCMYLYGFHSSEGANYIEASRWLKEFISHIENETEKTEELSLKIQCARGMLANLYYSGCVLYEEQSFKKTMELLENIATEDTAAFSFDSYMEKLIFMVSDGVGTEFDFQRIIACFEKYRDKCTNSAKNNMAKFYMRYGMYEEAIKILESIEEIHPDVEYKLGTIYLQGLHVTPPKPDIYRAEHYLRRAADRGHLDALHALGLMNFRGQYGYRKNMAEAREYFLKAASKGHRAAQYDYAWMCKYGLGGESNLLEAIHFFEESANKGHVFAIAELAVLYQNPACVNYQKAFEWAKKAAASGEPQSEFVLGNLYYFGRGCESNLNDAVLWYKKALKHGFYQAKFMLDKIQMK